MGSAQGLTLEIYDENNVTFFASRVGGGNLFCSLNLRKPEVEKSTLKMSSKLLPFLESLH